MGRVVIRVKPGGAITYTAEGIKGERCVKLITELAEKGGGQVLESEHTQEFYEQAPGAEQENRG